MNWKSHAGFIPSRLVCWTVGTPITFAVVASIYNCLIRERDLVSAVTQLRTATGGGTAFTARMMDESDIRRAEILGRSDQPSDG
jgi:hypothetical protein